MPWIFFCVIGDDDARQMLLETQVRLARETVWVRLDRPKKTVNFALDFAPAFRHDRICRILLLNLHPLLPTGPAWVTCPYN
jgi:hypothetical protein